MTKASTIPAPSAKNVQRSYFDRADLIFIFPVYRELRMMI